MEPRNTSTKSNSFTRGEKKSIVFSEIFIPMKMVDKHTKNLNKYENRCFDIFNIVNHIINSCHSYDNINIEQKSYCTTRRLRKFTIFIV